MRIEAWATNNRNRILFGRGEDSDKSERRRGFKGVLESREIKSWENKFCHFAPRGFIYLFGHVKVTSALQFGSLDQANSRKRDDNGDERSVTFNSPYLSSLT